MIFSFVEIMYFHVLIELTRIEISKYQGSVIKLDAVLIELTRIEIARSPHLIPSIPPY